MYNETIRDLLLPSGPLALREKPDGSAEVAALSRHSPVGAQAVFDMIATGNSNRTQARPPSRRLWFR